MSLPNRPEADESFRQRFGSKSEKRHDVSPPYDSGEGTAEDLLAVLGYESELVRSRSTAGVAFMSFVLSSAPYGLATTLYYPLVGGGPVVIIWGWVLVCLIILCLSVSLGEITSVFPTAGGVYYQTFMLASPGSQRLLGWMCGWAFMMGNIIITLSVNFGTTLFFIGCVNIFQDAEGVGIWVTETYHIYLVFAAVTLICFSVSAFGNRFLPKLDMLTVGWTFGGVLAILITVLAVARNGRHSAEYAFTNFEPVSGWTPGWAYCVGLLHAAYATSAAGMILSMCEEVQKPATQVPIAMIWSILMILFCGLLFLVPLCFVLPDISAILNDAYAQPFPVIIRSAIGNEGGAFALTVPIIILAFFCGIACTTSASRCIWAFSRDGAVPGSHLWKQVNRKLDVPLNAMMFSMTVQLLLGLIYFGSYAAFNAFNGSGVIFLTLAYVMPVAVSFFRGRKTIAAGAFNMGKIGYFCNIVSIAWCALAIPLFSMPSGIPTSLPYMNYGSVVFVAGLLFALTFYYAHGKRHYTGPPVQGDAAEVAVRRASIISQK